MVITETVISETETSYQVQQLFIPRTGIKIHFYGAGKTIAEAMSGIVTEVAKYCTQTGLHPAQIIDSKTYINNMGAGHAH